MLTTREDLINGRKLYRSRRRTLTSAEKNNTVTLQNILNEYGAEGWAFYSFEENVITFNYVGRFIEYQVHSLTTIGLINKFNELGRQFLLFLGSIDRNAVFAYIGYDGSQVQYTTLNLENIPESEIQSSFERLGQQRWQYIGEYRERPIFGLSNNPVTLFASPMTPEILENLQMELNFLGDANWQYIGNMSSVDYVVFAQGDRKVEYSYVDIGNPSTETEEFFNQKGKDSCKYVGSGFGVHLFMKPSY